MKRSEPPPPEWTPSPEFIATTNIAFGARRRRDHMEVFRRCIAAGAHISSSFGKHSNDFMLSFYVQTPGGFDLEFGCGGLQPDWKTWVPTHSLIPDLWGHRWSPPPATS
jgi:hypothetical protein